MNHLTPHLSNAFLRNGRAIIYQNRVAPQKAFFTNITYSGGAEAYDGQGGFCGSAGSAKLDPKKIKVHHEALMHIEDLQRLSRDMEEFRYLSNLARKSIGRESFQANVRARNLVTDSAFVRALERLEFKSQPVWGLSINERKMVKDARNASNEAQDASIIH